MFFPVLETIGFRVFLPRKPYVEDLRYMAVKEVWSYHLLASPPGDVTLVSLLRKITPWTDSDVFSDLHTVHASRIVEWLKVFRLFKIFSYCNT